MEDNHASHDVEIEEVTARIETTRDELSQTIEALVYKTDVPARTSDAINNGMTTATNVLNDGVENVKDVAALASEIAGEQSRIAVEQAKSSATSAIDAVATAAAGVNKETRRTVFYALLGVFAFCAAIVIFRRRQKSDESTSANSGAVI